MALPLAVLFMVGGGVYAVLWNKERQENPCIDCVRQKEIADEIYFGKKSADSHRGSRI